MIRGLRWQQVKALVDQALDQPADERPTFLATVCGGDELLRRQVESFLEEQELAGDFLERPILSLSTDGDREPAAGRRIGPYRLLRQLGRGGMGIVYMAERADGELEQQVALKLLKRGLDTDDIVRRFNAERQILADLSHPYVARFLDAGTTEDGLPFYVMEHVRGEPITDYCDARALPTRERLKLFRKVCSAVQFAHQNLVVHRDLKPANILVRDDGTPKLLDFGIAKLLRDDPRFFLTATSLGASPMTPHCASPEQVRGEPVTTATDVYALGVLLYELLSGHRPYRLETLLPDQVVRAVCEKAPPKPSTAVSRTEEVSSPDDFADVLTPESVSRVRDGDPGRLRRRLHGDLDNIVLKAMHKEPERRFSSVEQLSDDLGRFLEDLPVRARGDAFTYRAVKFVRRHKIALAASATAFALIFGFAVTMAVQRDQIARQRDQIEQARQAASRERDQAREAEDFVLFVLEALKLADPSQVEGRNLTVREALDEVAGGIHDSLGDQPEKRGEMMGVIGGVYRRLGLYSSARGFLEHALRLREESLGRDHRLVAEALHNLANVERHLGNREGAEACMRRALAIQRVQFPEGHRDLARGLNNLASFLKENGALAEAEALVREGLEMKRRLFGEEHAEVAGGLNTLAGILWEKGDLAAAEETYRRSLEMRLAHEGELKTGVAKVMGNLGYLLLEEGDLEGARAWHEQALEIRRRLWDKDHPDLVTSLKNLALVQARQNDAAAAEALIGEAIEMQRRLTGEGAFGMAALLKDLALVRFEMGQPGRCEALAADALALFTDLDAPLWRIAEVRSIQAGCLAKRGRFEEAEPVLLESYRTLSELLGRQARPSQQALARIVVAYETSGRGAEAAPFRALSRSVGAR